MNEEDSYTTQIIFFGIVRIFPPGATRGHKDASLASLTYAMRGFASRVRRN